MSISRLDQRGSPSRDWLRSDFLKLAPSLALFIPLYPKMLSNILPESLCQNNEIASHNSYFFDLESLVHSRLKKKVTLYQAGGNYKAAIRWVGEKLSLLHLDSHFFHLFEQRRPVEAEKLRSPAANSSGFLEGLLDQVPFHGAHRFIKIDAGITDLKA